MSFYGLHRSLAGFGFVGDAIVSGIGFDEQWSLDDWTKNSWNSDYQPLSGNVISKARDVFKALQDAVDMGSPSAPVLIASFIAQDGANSISDWAAKIDQLTRAGGYGKGGYFGQRRIDAYNGLNQALSRLATITPPDVDAELESIQATSDAKQAAQDAANAETASRKAAAAAAVKVQAAAAHGTAQAIADAQQAIAAAAQAKAQAQAAAKAHVQAQQIATAKHADTAAAVKTPLIIAAVAVPVLGIVWMAMRRKKTSVAGYRRRSRR